MERYLIDTNVISDYFAESLPTEGLEFLDQVINDTPNLSVISKIELLSWKTKKSIEKKVRDFINDSLVFDLSDDIIQRTVHIRRTKKVKTPDAIIAATAISNGFSIITNDEKDFKKIRQLRIINPHRL